MIKIVKFQMDLLVQRSQYQIFNCNCSMAFWLSQVPISKKKQPCEKLITTGLSAVLFFCVEYGDGWVAGKIHEDSF